MLAALAALAVLLWFLDAPFSPQRAGQHGDIGDEVACMQAKIGWNFVVHPQAVHRFWPLANEATVPADHAVHYKTHPPLCYLALGLAQGLLGRETWAVRLVPLLSCVLTLWLIERLARRTLGSPASWCVLAVFATLPLTLKHGTGLGFEFFCQPLLLAAWLVYLRDPALRGRTLLSLLGLWILGAWSDIAGHYGPLTVLADVLLFRRDLGLGRRLRLALAGVVTAAGLFLLVQLHSAWASREPIDWQRISGGALELAPPWSASLHALWTHGSHLLGVPALGLALVGSLGHPHAVLTPGPAAAPLRPWVAILCAGLGHCLMLRRHALQHEFWLSYTGPAVAALAVAALLALRLRGRLVPVLLTALCAFQLVAGVLYRQASIDPAARDFGLQVRACVDGDRGEVAVVPFAPGSERTVGFYARAIIARGVTRDDAAQIWLRIHGAQDGRRILLLTPEQRQQHAATVATLFPGLELTPCGPFLRGDVTRFFQ